MEVIVSTVAIEWPQSPEHHTGNDDPRELTVAPDCATPQQHGQKCQDPGDQQQLDHSFKDTTKHGIPTGSRMANAENAHHVQARPLQRQSHYQRARKTSTTPRLELPTTRPLHNPERCTSRPPIATLSHLCSQALGHGGGASPGV